MKGYAGTGNEAARGAAYAQVHPWPMAEMSRSALIARILTWAVAWVVAIMLPLLLLSVSAANAENRPAASSPELPEIVGELLKGGCVVVLHPGATRQGASGTDSSQPALSDGLDVPYDHSKPDPMPEAWLANLNQMARLGAFPRERS